MEDTLNQKQQSFVENYIRNGFNIQQAMIDSGYKPSYAQNHQQELIRHPIISERLTSAIRAHQREQFNKTVMAIDERMNVLERIVRECVPKDREAKVNMKYAKDAIIALQEINKLCGDYAPDKRLRLTVDLTQNKLHEARKAYDEF
jgi:phage terminase small subunit